VPDVLEQLREALGDRYEIERLVGEGGMATVFLAQDRRHGRRVAIKTLRAELAASIGADRFLREIHLAASLQHANILGLYDSGEANGILYYVMPFVEGESLRDRLNHEQQLPLFDAVRIAREAAEGLAYAHEHGVVHRDIKPENIMLQNGHALVADFGIARAADAAGEKLTQTGMAVGTPHYMSPEQALGADHADGRSDIYSLGCVLYELLAGQPPFDGPNSRSIMARHAMEQVPSIQVVRQSVPDELEDAVMLALEKTPADRFQKMSEFADLLADLEPTLATRRTTSRGTPVLRRSTSSGEQAVRRSTSGEAPVVKRSTPQAILGEKWGTGKRLWAVVGMVMAVSGVAGVGAYHALAKPAPARAGFDPNRVAVLYFENRSGNDSLTSLADGVTEALIHELSEVKPLQVISRNGVAPYRDVAVPPDSIGRALKVGTLVEGTIAQSEKRLRLNVSLIDAASGDEIGSKTLERPREEIFDLQDDVAKEVSLFLRERLGQEIQVQALRVGTRNPKAWELVQQAGKLSKDVDALLAAGDTTAAARRLNEADSILASVEKLDAGWITPPIERGWVAYRQMDLIPGFDKTLYSKWIALGLEHANRATQLKADDPDALELRGILEYWRWILNLEPDQAAAKQLLASAERDMRAAVAAKPNAARAWTYLSHLLSGQGQTAESKLAAVRSYEADPYLSSAKQTLSSLFDASFDLEDKVEAEHWCTEGQRRFPEYFRFTECQLWLMGMKGQKPDIAKAWKVNEEFVKVSPPNLRPFNTLYGNVLVALALARAGLADSARSVLMRSRGDAGVDATRDLAYYEALVRIQLGDKDEAFRLLSTYVAANPQRRSGIAKDETWMMRDLRSDPRFVTAFGKPGES
jgi:serine/threonine-protein kinase